MISEPQPHIRKKYFRANASRFVDRKVKKNYIYNIIKRKKNKTQRKQSTKTNNNHRQNLEKFNHLP